ncbi:MAG: hypothetical protein KCHDKBKB_01554 [Elusimicrobia bacterium]|nr:hypothetical protein [Elusimicrobiota bacterium]
MPELPKELTNMPKKPKAPKSKTAKEANKIPVPVVDTATAADKTPKGRPPLRAIRVDDELLKAAKEYKKASGKSFYTLGYEAVRDRLVKEGFLEPSPQEKP